MNSAKSNSPVYEFLPVINIAKQTNNLIYPIKVEFGNKYKSVQAIHSTPYIILMKFLQNKSNVDIVKNLFKEFCDTQPKFEINLSGFGFFNFHTVYIKIPEKKDIVGMSKKIKRNLAQKKNLIPEYFTLSDPPHVTIARSLSDQFRNAYSEYSKKNFRSSFIAESITLLTRVSASDVKNVKWEDKSTFKFGKDKKEEDEELKLF